MNTENKVVPKNLPILIWPDSRLKKQCIDVTTFLSDDDNTFGQLFVDMALTAVTHNGIALAAPQVGVPVNMIVMLTEKEPMAILNPKIISASTDNLFSWEEGCLSVPGYFEMRKRPAKVVVEFDTITGERKEVEFHGLSAFVIQHEIDHLNGKVFVDGLSQLKTTRVKRKIKKTLKFS